jgi:uroporphyrinogen decarboxylase
MSSESLLLNVLQGKEVSRPPIWFMRQAGRYLPEYQSVRAKHSMLDVIRTPELAAQITLQPLERFELDAAIIFADILNPLIGMGFSLDFIEGHGPKIHNPVYSPACVDALKIPDVAENSGYTLRAIEYVCEVLKPRNIPVFGFAGSPFTLSYYVIEGEGKGNLVRTKEFMLREPAAWDRLQTKLSELVIEYLVAQVHAGASALQLFDSWAGALARHEYQKFVFPYVKTIISAVKSQVPDTPLIYFAPNTGGYFRDVVQVGANGYSVDWRMPLDEAARITGPGVPLQGNLDPALLFAPWDYVKERAKEILEQGRSIGGLHIFNLGHGILPRTPVDTVARLVDYVRRMD